MHSCLQVAEIQLKIFNYVSAADGASLARTCRSFYEPGMDAAWKSLAGFAPLVNCISSDLVHVKDRNEEGSHVHVLTSVSLCSTVLFLQIVNDKTIS